MRTHIRTVAVAVGLVAGLVGVAAPSQARSDAGAVLDLGIDECANDVNGLGAVVTTTHLYRQGRTYALPGGLDAAARINDRGQVAGTDGDLAALWDGRRLVRIGVADPADTYSYATGLNTRGDVVGTSGSYGGRTRAFVWSGGTVRVLPDLGGNAGATGINAAGQVVGYVRSATGPQRAALWEPDGTLVQLGALGDGGGHSLAAAINDRGDVVGYSYTQTGAGPVRAVRWGATRAVEPIDGGGTVFAQAADVNGRGRVVGNLQLADGYQQGFVRDAQGEVRPLAPQADGDTSVLNAVNESGTAVGCVVAADGTERAVMVYGTR
ncbi:hypothetical protein [Cellulomonas sp.]|uniref:hypothetical protein n=1 Tax=Cellulomonas sp. TaxID=40001 RepID=UPI001B183E5F|nr:hypothetical protein [Cellulomonas sp.]MBO9553934.1 hypothetical protein [Cellulomonas sp.]